MQVSQIWKVSEHFLSLDIVSYYLYISRIFTFYFNRYNYLKWQISITFNLELANESWNEEYHREVRNASNCYKVIQHDDLYIVLAASKRGSASFFTSKLTHHLSTSRTRPPRWATSYIRIHPTTFALSVLLRKLRQWSHAFVERYLRVYF